MKKRLNLVVLSVLVSAAFTCWAEQSATDRQISFYQTLVSKSPNDSSSYDRLGAAYLQKGRETSDSAYYGLAETALTKSLELASPVDMSAAAPLMHLAEFCMAEHRFSEAVDYAQRSLTLGSGDLSPFALLGDAYTDMGKYDQASEAYAKLSAITGGQNRGLAYMHDIRVSYLEFLRGDNAAAIRLGTNAVTLALLANMPGENSAWTYYQLGELLFLSGNLSDADTAYQQALIRFPGFYRALGGLAKVRVAQRRYQEGIELYEQAIDVIPFPDYIAALGDVYTKLGQPKQARQQYDLVEYIGTISAFNQRAYNRELAIFYADHDMRLKESLELAQREVEVRRDIYTQDVPGLVVVQESSAERSRSGNRHCTTVGDQRPLAAFSCGNDLPRPR